VVALTQRLMSLAFWLVGTESELRSGFAWSLFSWVVGGFAVLRGRFYREVVPVAARALGARESTRRPQHSFAFSSVRETSFASHGFKDLIASLTAALSSWVGPKKVWGFTLSTCGTASDFRNAASICSFPL
jgi:hypothetical protein